MHKYYTVIFAFLLFALPVRAQVVPGWSNPFRAQLHALVKASVTNGFESLKGTEIARGEWTCRMELDGFVTTVREKENNPMAVLNVHAASVNAAAYKYASALANNGLQGYKLRDSNTDRSISLNKGTESRKLIFSKQEKYVSSIVTVVFTAHEDKAVILTIETR